MKDTALRFPHPESIDGSRPPTVGELYVRHASFVSRSLRYFRVHESSMDDAVQDVFLVVHRRLAEFKGRSAIKTWLFAIARWVALGYRRSLRRRLQHLIDTPVEEIDETPARLEGPLEEAARREALAILARVLQRLDEQRRALFVMVALEGMTIGAAATAQGINMNTAHTRLRATWATLENHLDRKQKRRHAGTNGSDVLPGIAS